MVATAYEARVATAVAGVQDEWSALADPSTAEAMAAYMKTDMAFYGIKSPQRAPAYRTVLRLLEPTTDVEYEYAVRAFWELPHREEKYLAIGLAADWRAMVGARHLPLYRDLIVEGAWWDFVDPVAAKCVGKALLDEREVVAPVMERWVDDDDMWLRRSALLAHLGHKGRTDEATLFEHCLRLSGETEFFIRKAIGWVLREYAKTAPDNVARFVVEHRDRWSGLTFREATKHLSLG